MTKAIIIIALSLICSICAFAQDVVTHTVDRGETLASIADKYGVDQEQIIRLNPEAASFVYAGMELKIPVSANAPASPASATQPYAESSHESYDFYNSWTTFQVDDSESNAVNRIYIGYSPMFISSTDKHATLDGISLGFTGAYKFLSSSDNLMLGFDANACYNFLSVKANEANNKLSIASFGITPLLAYRVNISEDIRLLLYIGPTATINVWGKAESNGQDSNLFGKSGYDWQRVVAGVKSGINIDIQHFSIGVGGGYDFMHLYGNSTQSSFVVSIGYNI